MVGPVLSGVRLKDFPGTLVKAVHCVPDGQFGLYPAPAEAHRGPYRELDPEKNHEDYDREQGHFQVHERLVQQHPDPPFPPAAWRREVMNASKQPGSRPC
jgi:hypothetical protein